MIHLFTGGFQLKKRVESDGRSSRSWWSGHHTRALAGEVSTALILPFADSPLMWFVVAGDIVITTIAIAGMMQQAKQAKS